MNAVGQAAAPERAPLRPHVVARVGDAVVRVRRIREDDAADLERFYEELDFDTRWLRFHASTKGISPRQSAWFCRPDADRHEGFVAVVGERRHRTEHIVGHLCLEPSSATTAEIAIVVAPAYQRRGIGRRMVQDAVGWARHEGIQRLTATMVVGNEPIRRLLTTLRLPTTWTSMGAGTCTLAIDITRPQAPARRRHAVA